jgi:hypothetical protein
VGAPAGFRAHDLLDWIPDPRFGVRAAAASMGNETNAMNDPPSSSPASVLESLQEHNDNNDNREYKSTLSTASSKKVNIIQVIITFNGAVRHN